MVYYKMGIVSNLFCIRNVAINNNAINRTCFGIWLFFSFSIRYSEKLCMTDDKWIKLIAEHFVNKKTHLSAFFLSFIFLIFLSHSFECLDLDLLLILRIVFFVSLYTPITRPLCDHFDIMFFTHSESLSIDLLMMQIPLASLLDVYVQCIIVQVFV